MQPGDQLGLVQTVYEVLQETSRKNFSVELRKFIEVNKGELVKVGDLKRLQQGDLPWCTRS